MEPYSDLSYDDDHFLERPPDDVHSKQLNETPGYSRTKAMTSIPNAFSASKKLQQLLGIMDTKVEPYTRPPPMPQDLEQRFLTSLLEYSINLQMPSGDLWETQSHAASRQNMVGVGAELGKAALEMIREERESPAEATHTQDGLNWNPSYEAVYGGEYSLTGNELSVSPYASDYHCVSQQANVSPYGLSTALCSSSASANDYEEDYYSHDPYAGFTSSTTLVQNQPSRPGSSSIATTQPASGQSFAPQIANYDPGHHHADYGWINAEYTPPVRSSSLLNLMQHGSYLDGEGQTPVFYDGIYTQAQNSHQVPEHSGNIPPVLFPSPRVEQEESWDFVQTDTGDIAPHGFTPGGSSPSSNNEAANYATHSNSGPQKLPVPQVMVQAPSPEKMLPPATKKRRASSQGAPPAKFRASDNTVGLPVLSANQEILWKVKFPGNTYALLTIILTWSLTIRRLFIQLPHPRSFSINAAFPYLIKPPIYQKLVSVSFYDTSVTPNKEIRFIGSNHCAEMSYNEVDIFTYPEADSIPFDTTNLKANAVKRAFGFNVSEGKDCKHMPMRQRANTGEGRWSYILFQGHSNPSELSPPHTIIAWPTCAITNSSECLHTIYPDTHPRPTELRRFTSLQNLATSMRLQQNLRAASSEHLPEANLGQVEGALTLKRRVVKMEKAGRMPLIEGYRVDVRKWERWLEAVGKGKGKVMLWMER